MKPLQMRLSLRLAEPFLNHGKRRLYLGLPNKVNPYRGSHCNGRWMTGEYLSWGTVYNSVIVLARRRIRYQIMQTRAIEGAIGDEFRAILLHDQQDWWRRR